MNVDQLRAKCIKNAKIDIAWLLFSIVLLLIAYLPSGYYAAIVGIEIGLDGINSNSNFLYKIWNAWLIIAVIIGNLQIFLCFLSLGKENRYFQNDYLKLLSIVAQLSWVYPAFIYYPWYFWVIGSAIIYVKTPNSFLSIRCLNGKT